MDYPIEILPGPTFKLIDCDLTDYFLIRHVDISKEESLIDADTNVVYKKYICPQSDHIEDLSTSLLGIFKTNYIYIAFTAEGGIKYFAYCYPNEIVEVPEFEKDFFNKEERKYWWVPIGKLHNREFIYNVGENQVSATCLVIHTPTKWNYWHFSLRWKTNIGLIGDLEEKKKRNIARKIGHSAIVAISQFAKVTSPEYTELPNECYCIA
jgi:hypothetical protein